MYKAFIIITLYSLPLLSACALSPQATDISNNMPSSTQNVVLLHGLGRSKLAMWHLAERLEERGFRVIRIGYPSLTQAPESALNHVANEINDCCTHLSGITHFVGHSLGGLMIRAYLHENRIPNLGRIVLMGSPNQGTPLVDRLRDKWWARLAGPTAMSLGTEAESFPSSLPLPYYPVGIIAGSTNNASMEKFLPGDDDGVVPVESTKIAGMQDFILLHVGHSAMRNNVEVAEQVAHFLHHGRFRHPSDS